jgi:hypothetical protein
MLNRPDQPQINAARGDFDVTLFSGQRTAISAPAPGRMGGALIGGQRGSIVRRGPTHGPRQIRGNARSPKTMTKSSPSSAKSAQQMEVGEIIRRGRIGFGLVEMRVVESVWPRPIGVGAVE